MNMKEWTRGLHASRKPLPILTYPVAVRRGVSVYALTHDADVQADVVTAGAELMKNAAAAVTVMDLSVEAEAFGSPVNAPENEVANVTSAILFDESDADALAVPEIGAGRTGIFIEAAKNAKQRITDRPVFAGMIGPYSLAGRLMDVSEIMMNCLCEPDFVHKTLRKATDFLISYAQAYKTAGLDGIVLAEPLSGLLSPALEREFTLPYCVELISAVQDESFAVIYHNCGPNIALMTDSLAENGAYAYHFGDAADIGVMLQKMPNDRAILGNISPSRYFVGGTPGEMESAVASLLEKCGNYGNFTLSSGCDVPPTAKWENVEAFFKAAE